LDERHWLAIDVAWEIAAVTGKPATAKAIAERVGVAVPTINNWRSRKDFLAAQSAVAQLVLHEWKPVLVDKALKLATGGDKRLLMFFLERIFPLQSDPSDPAQKTSINISMPGWNTPEDASISSGPIVKIIATTTDTPIIEPQPAPIIAEETNPDVHANTTESP
jgi:hypothetical protein